MSERAPDIFLFHNESAEQDRMPQIEVTQIAPGLAFGFGEISKEKISHDDLALVEDTILQNPDILIAVDTDDYGNQLDDDGCGDGREVKTVFTRDEQFNKSLNRSKVFGGGATMATAIMIGTGNAGEAPLNDVFSASMAKLRQSDVNFGAHTDETANDEKCGCGAIDRAPDALAAALRYERPIRGVIEMLDGVDTTELDTVYDNYREYVPLQLLKSKEYDSAQVMDEIVSKETKVVKQLGGQHLESGIVLNEVEGFTVNQKLVRDVTGSRAQTFAVDVWRLQEIAEKVTSGDPKLSQQAMLSELIYTLAIAAVLTQGDLPVYKIEKAETQSTAYAA